MSPSRQRVPGARSSLDQVREGAGLVRLARREDKGERQAAGVAAQVQLGGEPAARASQGLTVLPPLAPAACWWARTTVLSSICKRSSAAPLPARAAKSASSTPRSRQRANRRQTVFHFPYRSGTARQRAPSRARHRVPSRTGRLSCPGGPGRPPAADPAPRRVPPPLPPRGRPPARPLARPPQDAVQDRPVLVPGPARPPALSRQQRPDQLPFRVRQIARSHAVLPLPKGKRT